MVALTFLGLILAGAFLLMLPISHRDGMWMPFLDALFTATSASCVTGLVVCDTGKVFSLFGQLVIIGLIQLGGLGLMLLPRFFRCPGAAHQSSGPHADPGLTQPE